VRFKLGFPGPRAPLRPPSTSNADIVDRGIWDFAWTTRIVARSQFVSSLVFGGGWGGGVAETRRTSCSLGGGDGAGGGGGVGGGVWGGLVGKQDVKSDPVASRGGVGAGPAHPPPPSPMRSKARKSPRSPRGNSPPRQKYQSPSSQRPQNAAD